MELCDSVEKLKKRYIITIDKKVTNLIVRSKNLKIRNLPKGHKMIDSVNSKPFVFFSFCLVIGVLLIILCQSYLIGGILTVLSLYNFFCIKNEKLMEFYDEFVVFYHINSYKDECFLLFWEDIESWKITHTKKDYDEILLRLKNGKTVCLKCVSKHKVQRYFKRYANQADKKAVLPSHTS